MTATQLVDVIPISKENLHREENEVRECLARSFEDFYHIGESLRRIKDNRLYEAETDDDGEPYDSWSAYCRSGRLDYNRSHSERLILASEYRPALADLSPIGDNWTEWTVRELTRLPSKKDAGRVSKKIVKHIEKTGERLTAALVKRFVDDDLQPNRPKQSDYDESTPDAVLKKGLHWLVSFNRAMTMIEDMGVFVQDAEEASPGIVKLFTTELDQLKRRLLRS